jgi:hypothetical protein
VDGKALLGNDPIKQQLESKMFYVVGAVVISRVWSQLQKRVTTEKSAEAVHFEVELDTSEVKQKKKVRRREQT